MNNAVRPKSPASECHPRAVLADCTSSGWVAQAAGVGGKPPGDRWSSVAEGVAGGRRYRPAGAPVLAAPRGRQPGCARPPTGVARPGAGCGRPRAGCARPGAGVVPGHGVVSGAGVPASAVRGAALPRAGARASRGVLLAAAGASRDGIPGRVSAPGTPRHPGAVHPRPHSLAAAPAAQASSGPERDAGRTRLPERHRGGRDRADRREVPGFLAAIPRGREHWPASRRGASGRAA